MRDLFEEAGIVPQQSNGPRDLFAEAGIEMAPKGSSAQPGQQPNSLARQVGLTARYGLEGLANAAQLGTEPIRYVTDRLFGQTGNTRPLGAMATEFADRIGLPSPQTRGERIIGDASRLVAGAGGMAGGAGTAANLIGRTAGPIAPNLLPEAFSKVDALAGGLRVAPRAIAQGMAANPTAQLTSAAGAGLASGQARENGAGAGAQAVSALVGGVAGGMVPGAVSGVANAARNAVNRTVNRLSPQQMDLRITQILDEQGIDFNQLTTGAKAAMRNQMKDALNTGKELDPVAVRRLADFSAVGATPTRGMVTLDPVQVTREQNLAKIAANTNDDALSGLPLIQNRNNQALIGRLNDLGAGQGDPLRAGEALSGAVAGRRDALRSAEQAAWDAAKSAPGYRQPIEANVISRINGALDEEGLMPFMNKTISDHMAEFQTGNRPFTPQDYRNLQSLLSREMAKGGNEAAAAGVAARVLNSTDLRPINPVGHITTPVPAGVSQRLDDFLAQPGQAIDAVNHARAATRAAYGFESSSPVVKAALGGADPERLAQRFIVGGTYGEAQEVARLMGQSPAARDAIVTHLKNKALNNHADEVGKFSQSAYNNALKSIGDRKLSLFFSPEEVAQLKAVGRVASYTQVQPVGSAVNNSNSGATLIGKGLDALSGIAGGVGRIPLLRESLAGSLRQWHVDGATRQAQNVVPGLLANAPGRASAPGLLVTPGLLAPGVGPAAAYGGLLAAPN